MKKIFGLLSLIPAISLANTVTHDITNNQLDNTSTIKQNNLTTADNYVYFQIGENQVGDHLDFKAIDNDKQSPYGNNWQSNLEFIPQRTYASYKGVESLPCDNKKECGFKVNVQVDRYGDVSLPNRIMNQIDNFSFFKENTTFLYTPKFLNFGIFGKLCVMLHPTAKSDAFQTVCFNDIFLGQGQEDFYNNWWFGGKNCKPTHDRYNLTVYCYADNGQKYIFERGNNGLSGQNQVYIYSKPIDNITADS